MIPLTNDLSTLKQQQVYTDLNQLQSINQYSDADKHQALREVAQQFESIFMQTILSSMRSANDVFAKDNFLNSFEMDFHKDMLDKQLTLSLAEGRGFGLAELLYRQLTREYSPQSASTVKTDNLSDTKPIVQHNPYGEPLDVVKQRTVDIRQLSKLQTPADFIALTVPYAQQIAEDLGVDYRVLVAQSALETGWGKHILSDGFGQSSFNLFNIKADQRWQGKQVSTPTLEYVNGVAQQQQAQFRRYGTIAESFADYAQFLRQPRYQQALASAENTPKFLQELQKANYATDPHYAAKIEHIFQHYLADNHPVSGSRQP